MRDIAVTLAVIGSLPFILRRPWLGILVWSWLGFMNPHRMAWGFSRDLPFAMIVAITTLVAVLFSKEAKKVPWTRESVVLMLLLCWMVVTTAFAIYPALAVIELEKVLKIQLMIFVTLLLINNKQRLELLVLTIALSIGFYGVKGGIFTIAHGGVYRVQGPPGSFIGGNNEIGLALAMTVPLLYYCARQVVNRWLRLGMLAAMILTALAAIGTQSRGALLGIGAMGAMFWLKSRQKLMIAMYAVVAAVIVLQIMPQTWYERMYSMTEYQHDASATGRINAWVTAWNLAVDRPLVGGGFNVFQPLTFRRYAPDPRDVHDVHSIYFEMLGEHGFVGFGLFMLLGAFTWWSANGIRRAGKRIPELTWLGELAGLVQVSMVAYAVAGAFLGLAYFDYYYNLVAIVIVGKMIVAQYTARGGDRVTEKSDVDAATSTPVLPRPSWESVEGQGARRTPDPTHS